LERERLAVEERERLKEERKKIDNDTPESGIAD
jgi:hypothetical protein